MSKDFTGDFEEISFTRADAERLTRVENTLETLKVNTENEFNTLSKKLDEILKIRDNVHKHSIWIKVLIWSTALLISTVVATASKIIFLK